MVTSRAKYSRWWIAAACLFWATPSVWAGNVSPTIQDTGASVGIGTTTPNSSYKLDVFNSQILNTRTDGIAGGLGAQQRASWTTPRVIFNFFADGFDGTGVLRNLATLRDTFQSTVVLITHSAEVAAACDRVLVLADGREAG